MRERLISPDQSGFFDLPVRADSFASASLHKNPLLYPGEHPATSFITDGTFVSVIKSRNTGEGLSFSIRTEKGEQDLDEYLVERGAAPIEDRIPVIGYGSNLCPGSLKSKFSKIGRDDALIIPTVYSELRDADVVWSASPGTNGNHIAILYDGPEVAGTTVRVGLNMLTREQLLVMHATELNYDLRQVTLDIDGVSFPVYYYSGGSIMRKQGIPVAVQGTEATNRNLTSETARQLLASMLSNPSTRKLLDETVDEVDTKIIRTPEEYIRYINSLKPNDQSKTPRYDFKQFIQQGLENAENTSNDSMRRGNLVSWANPSTLPTFGESLAGVSTHDVYRLPEMEIPAQTWGGEAAKRRLVLRGVSTHNARITGAVVIGDTKP